MEFGHIFRSIGDRVGFCNHLIIYRVIYRLAAFDLRCAGKNGKVVERICAVVV